MPDAGPTVLPRHGPATATVTAAIMWDRIFSLSCESEVLAALLAALVRDSAQ